MKNQRYSRLAETQAKKAKKTALFYVVTSIIIVFILFFYGFNYSSKITAFVLNAIGKKTTSLGQDNLPPASPKIFEVDEYTNKENYEISGTSEAGSEIIIFVNDNEEKALTNSSGIFQTNIKLKKGLNTIYAKAIDDASNESLNSETVSITLDTTPPMLKINEPTQKTFIGNDNKKIKIKGETENNVQIHINNNFVFVNSDNTFEFEIELSEGEQEISIIAIDEAQNETEIINFFNWQP